MNLQGWDTASLVSHDLINKAFEDNRQKLVTSFEFREAPIFLSGRFGPWRLVRGGSLQSLHVEIPIVEGTIRGLKRTRRTRLDGTVVTVEIGLRLLPRADAPDTRDLVFDLDGDATPEAKPIRFIGVEYQNVRLDEAQLEMTSMALIDCLNAHAAQVAFVFATIDARGTPTDAWLRLPHVDFANLETIDGPSYLAIMGARAKPTPQMALDRFDVKLLEGYPPAIFAASHTLYASGVLAPWMNEHFLPGRAKFQAASVALPGSKTRSPGARLVRPVNLPQRDGYQPVLKKLDLALSGAELLVTAEAQVHIGVGCNLQVRIQLKHRFAFDPKTQRFTLRPQGAPSEEHWFDANNPLGWIVAAGATIAEWLVPSLRESISGSLRAIAAKMDASANPLAQPRIWAGLRDFQASRFLARGCFWLADQRPAEPLTQQSRKTKEPA